MNKHVDIKDANEYAGSEFTLLSTYNGESFETSGTLISITHSPPDPIFMFSGLGEYVLDYYGTDGGRYDTYVSDTDYLEIVNGA